MNEVDEMTDGWTDNQTGRQTDRQTKEQMDCSIRRTDGLMDKA